MMRLSLGFAFALLMGVSPAAARDTLTIGINQFPATLHPSFESQLAKSYILGMTRRLLTTHDPDWQQICLMCLELPSLEKGTARLITTESGKEGIAVTYELPAEAVWGDGTPMTTEDIVFSWEVGRNEPTGVGNLELYRRIEKVEILSDKRFSFHVNKRTCDYEGADDFQILPAHIERAVFEADKAGYSKRTLYDGDPANPGLWFGPYRVTEVEPGAYVVLERNEKWWGKPPAFDRIVVTAIENTAALTANLLSGDIDYIAGELGPTLDQALAFERRHGDRFDFVYKPGLVYEHIDMMLNNPILKDLRVRRALIHAIDREVINQRLFDGRQPVAHANINPQDAVHNPDVRRYAYDPDAAAALLDEAGWTPGPDGIRQNADGAPLRLEIMTTAGNKTREAAQQVLQSNWKQVGVDVRIRNQPARVLFGETISQRKYTGMTMYAWLTFPENIPRSTLHSEEIPTEANGFSGQNYPGYRSAEMDKVIDDLEVVCEPEANQNLWNRAQALYADDLPVIPLYYRSTPYIFPKWLKGVRPTGHGRPSSLWVEEWTVAE